jgi:hypothetical protein
LADKPVRRARLLRVDRVHIDIAECSKALRQLPA